MKRLLDKFYTSNDHTLLKDKSYYLNSPAIQLPAPMKMPIHMSPFNRKRAIPIIPILFSQIFVLFMSEKLIYGNAENSSH
jgi:hypothetical protein